MKSSYRKFNKGYVVDSLSKIDNILDDVQALVETVFDLTNRDDDKIELNNIIIIRQNLNMMIQSIEKLKYLSD